MRKSRVVKNAGSFYEPFNWDAGRPSAHDSPSLAANAVAPPSSEEGIRAAYQNGFVEGQRASRASYDESIEAASKQLARSLNALSTLRSAIIRDARQDLLDLSLEIARRVVHRELQVDPDVLRGIVSGIVEKLDRQDVYRVSVHPTQVQSVEQEMALLGRDGVHPPVTGDPALPICGCILETAVGTIDAGIESQLNEIERGLTDLLSSTP